MIELPRAKVQGDQAVVPTSRDSKRGWSTGQRKAERKKHGPKEADKIADSRCDRVPVLRSILILLALAHADGGSPDVGTLRRTAPLISAALSSFAVLVDSPADWPATSSGGIGGADALPFVAGYECGLWLKACAR